MTPHQFGNRRPPTSEGVIKKEKQAQLPTEVLSVYELSAAYQERVLQLCRLLWPSRTPIHFTSIKLIGDPDDHIIDINVNQLRGLSSHGHHRGHVQTRDGQSEKLDLPPGNYKLRVKRGDPRGLQDEIAMLKFVEKHLSIRTPAVVHFNLSSTNNPLGSPYMLQRRIPGEKLGSVWHTLNATQKQSIALQMGQLHRELFEITNSAGGIPHMGMVHRARDPVRTTEPGLPQWHTDAAKDLFPLPPLNMLYDRMKRWADEIRKMNPRADGTEPWHGAAALARRLQYYHSTWGTEPKYHLHHKALFPRNIMVEVGTVEYVNVTGVLGWKDAEFAPAIAACLPPFWLWSALLWEPSYNGEETAWQFQEFDVSRGSKGIKLLFERIVGDEFMSFAYAENAHIARRLWRCAYQDLGDALTDPELEDIYVNYTAHTSSPETARARWTFICAVHGEYGNLRSRLPES